MEDLKIKPDRKEELANCLSLWDNRPAKGAEDVANKRDYQKERQAAIARGEKMIGVKVTEKMAADFTTRCQLEGTTKNAVLYNYIEQYTYGKSQPTRKEIVTPVGMISLSAWATKQGISRQRASTLLKDGRIPCAIQKGRYWYVPEEFMLEK